MIIECALASSLFFPSLQLTSGNCLFVHDQKGTDSPLCQHPGEQGLRASAYPSVQG